MEEKDLKLEEELVEIEEDEEEESALGLFSFFSGLFGLTIFGLIFGFVHLASKRQKYRKLAIAGIIISVVYTVISIVVATLLYSTLLTTLVAEFAILSSLGDKGVGITVVLLPLLLIVPFITFVLVMLKTFSK